MNYYDYCIFGENVLEDSIKVEEMGAVELQELLERISKRLDCIRSANRESKIQPYGLRIDRNYRIFIPELGDREIKMKAMAKCLFIFYLRHPEGVGQSMLASYRDELRNIYYKVCSRTELTKLNESIDRIISTSSQSYAVHKSQIRNILSEYFDQDRLRFYLIQNAAYGRKAIEIDRSLIEWED